MFIMTKMTDQEFRCRKEDQIMTDTREDLTDTIEGWTNMMGILREMTCMHPEAEGEEISMIWIMMTTAEDLGWTSLMERTAGTDLAEEAWAEEARAEEAWAGEAWAEEAWVASLIGVMIDTRMMTGMLLGEEGTTIATMVRTGMLLEEEGTMIATKEMSMNPEEDDRGEGAEIDTLTNSLTPCMMDGHLHIRRRHVEAQETSITMMTLGIEVEEAARLVEIPAAWITTK